MSNLSEPTQSQAPHLQAIGQPPGSTTLDIFDFFDWRAATLNTSGDGTPTDITMHASGSGSD